MTDVGLYGRNQIAHGFSSFDGRVENLNQLYLVINDFCTARCLLCDYWKHKERNFLTPGFVAKYVAPIIKKYKIAVVCVTGGEPTLHPQLQEITKLIKEAGAKVTLITTSTRLSQVFDLIKDTVDGYMLSLDADSEQMQREIRGMNNFKEIIGWPARIKKERPGSQVVFSCLIQKKNFERIVDIYGMMSRLPIDGIFFRVPDIKGYTFGRNSAKMPDNIKFAILDDGEIEVLSRNLGEISRRDTDRKLLHQHKDTFDRYIKYFMALNGKNVEFEDRKCRVPFNSIIIDENKNVKPCFYLPEHAQIEESTAESAINDNTMTQTRKKLAGERDEYREKYCNRCVQFLK